MSEYLYLFIYNDKEGDSFLVYDTAQLTTVVAYVYRPSYLRVRRHQRHTSPVTFAKPLAQRQFSLHFDSSGSSDNSNESDDVDNSNKVDHLIRYGLDVSDG